jgi:DNA-binding MarR family transcriptional regulator
MSRHLLDLGEIDRTKQPGLGLVEGRTNITNQREKIYGLTPKGRALVTTIVERAKP